MAFALIGIGLILFMAAYQNNVATLGAQLKSDVSGSGGFLIWVITLFIIGAIGYVPALRGLSRIFLVLVLVVIFLANRGVFQNLTDALGVPTVGDEENTNRGTGEPADAATPAAPSTGTTEEPATSGGGGW